MLSLLKSFLPAPVTLIAWGVSAALGFGVCAWWSIHQYNKGWHAAIDSVAAENTEAVNAVKKQRTVLADCYDRGGNWDQSRGLCDR